MRVTAAPGLGGRNGDAFVEVVDEGGDVGDELGGRQPDPGPAGGLVVLGGQGAGDPVVGAAVGLGLD